MKKKKKEERERERITPHLLLEKRKTCQPLLSPRLAERKLPAMPHALVTGYNLLKIFTCNRHRQKKREKNGCTCPRLQQLNNYLKERKRKNIFKKKRERRSLPESNPGQLNGSTACYPLLCGETSRNRRNLCLYCFSISFTAAFSCPTFVVFLK